MIPSIVPHNYKSNNILHYRCSTEKLIASLRYQGHYYILCYSSTNQSWISIYLGLFLFCCKINSIFFYSKFWHAVRGWWIAGIVCGESYISWFDSGWQIGFIYHESQKHKFKSNGNANHNTNVKTKGIFWIQNRKGRWNTLQYLPTKPTVTPISNLSKNQNRKKHD